MMHARRTIPHRLSTLIWQGRWMVTGMLVFIPALALIWWGRPAYPEAFPPLLEELDSKAWGQGAEALFPDRYQQFHHHILLPAVSSLFGIVFFTWMLGGISTSRGLTQLEKSSSPARQELKLATTKSLNIIVDTTENRLILKARGVPLRMYPLKHATWIGSPVLHSTAIHLKNKLPLISPMPIIPPSPSPSSIQPEDPLKPLTVHDMPHRFALVFQENFTILVQPDYLPSFWKNLAHQMAGWGERVAARIGTWTTSHQYLVIRLDPANAQALYWTANPPMMCLILPRSFSAK